MESGKDRSFTGQSLGRYTTVQSIKRTVPQSLSFIFLFRSKVKIKNGTTHTKVYLSGLTSAKNIANCPLDYDNEKTLFVGI